VASDNTDGDGGWDYWPEEREDGTKVLCISWWPVAEGDIFVAYDNGEAVA
jgi:hypothetical protein